MNRLLGGRGGGGVRVVVGLVWALVAAVASAHPARLDPDPRQIIREADAAMAKAGTLMFSAESRELGALAAIEPNVTGRVVFAEFKLNDPASWRFVAKGGVTWPDSIRSGDFHTLTSTDGVISIRPSAKEIIEAPLADADGLLDDGGRWLVWWLSAWPGTVAKPTLEPGPAKVTWEGRRAIDGVSCDIIRVDSSAIDEVETDAWWFISEDDRLPRRVDRLVVTPQGPGFSTMEIRDLKVGVEIDPGEFKFSIPVGYRIITDYEPPPVPPKFRARGRALLSGGAIVPDFELRTAVGERRKLSDVRGRVVLLAFFASWSKPSTEMLTNLKPLIEDLSKWDFTAWGLSAFDQGDPVTAAKDAGLKIDVLTEADPVARRFGITDLPALVVIGADGRTLLVRPGGSKADIDAVRAAISKVVK